MPRKTVELTGNQLQLQITHQLQTLGSLMSRAGLASAFGSQYGGSRDMYEALGYPVDITPDDYLTKYLRDIGKRIVNAPADATWRGDVEVVEDDSSTEKTTFEEAWDDLAKASKFFNKVQRLDRLVGLGRYGVLLIGFSDGEVDLSKPVVAKEGLKVLYLQPYAEQSAVVKKINSDQQSERYGLPETYTIQSLVSTTSLGTSGIGTGVTQTVETSKSIEVHWTRLLHVAEGLMENDIYGTPRMQAAYNRILDIEKVAGGSGEMYWRGARPGSALIADKDATLGQQDVDDMKSQLQDFNNNLTRFLRLKGMTVESLSPQVVSPKDHMEVQFMLISAVTAIPKRIFTGSERGELASRQDETNWKETIADRQDDYATPLIMEPFIDRMIELKVLPTPAEGYTVAWPDLLALGQKEKADIALSVAKALKEYTGALGADMIIPPDMFLELVLGFDKTQIERVKTALREMGFADRVNETNEEDDEPPVTETEE